MKEKGVTTITLKKINKGKVFQYIYREKITSKLQIVQDLQMGLSTVSQNLNELEQEGLIERNGFFESTGGRKAQMIQIVSDLKLSIGIGILKDMFHLVAVNLYGDAICMDTFPIAYSNTEEYYTKVAQTVEEFIEINHYDKEKILGISIATQGIISPDGSAVTYGAIMGNTEMKLSDFASRIPYPCRLEHDSKAAAYLELWNHASLDSAVVFLLNPNLGGAIITNHCVQHGMTMHSGTIEHTCVNPGGPLCYCGNRGCLETYCSANALESAVNMPAKEFFPLLRTDENNTLRQIWKDYLDHLAFAIKNLNMIIDSPVIISGYLAPYFTEEDLEYLLELVNNASPFSFDKEQLIVGTHGQYTPAIGAALFYVERFIESIS
ncbi:MAG: ROK family transcriptional regulator [Lachnospiraceae bacterium]|nr:ROK family transcriptional regulator [Lachnospiraceae bacterium]